MKATIKDMMEYGYKYIGVTPLTNYLDVRILHSKGNSVLILFPDNTEEYVKDAEDFVKYKDTVMYGIERNDAEEELIRKAIEELRENGSDTWREVLNILDFSDEDIKIAITEADLR